MAAFCEMLILPLRHQAQPVKLAGVFRAGGHKIDAGGFDGAVAQHIGQPCDVLTGFVKGRGEQ